MCSLGIRGKIKKCIKLHSAIIEDGAVFQIRASTIEHIRKKLRRYDMRYMYMTKASDDEKIIYRLHIVGNEEKEGTEDIFENGQLVRRFTI